MKTVSEILAHPRLNREMRLQNAMITMYCKQHHVYQGKVCRDCERLQQMTARKLAFCDSGPEKPTCATCTAVCYTPIVAKQVKTIYRWGRLRICLRHPILMSLYCFDSLKRSQMPKPKLLNL
ncbi:MAG: nitrous oxide-stimulated promoter family protein [Moritella sp.]|uniref:nitrous oxide-stimulated promoter family protein n=1 Tax=Moritella sp. TaxID=78556 RepID=UPI0029BEC44F|nr:nitrous oxide-stimulated promoter family protein [Moritella sp.]MDX2322140.1 nitrous oxide-stimulated promoter family protein [Moritella sp.]